MNGRGGVRVGKLTSGKVKEAGIRKGMASRVSKNSLFSPFFKQS